jgi:lysophospholipase L1-like esterase
MVILLFAGAAGPGMGLCVPRAIAQQTEAGIFRLVVLGSSTAAGEAARPLDSSWVNNYKRFLATQYTSSEVINLAVGGYTTFNIMPNGNVAPAPWNVPPYQVGTSNNITKALSLAPSLIIVNLPTNDICPDNPQTIVPVSQQLANYDVLIQRATAAGVPIWISTTQPRNTSTSAQRAMLKQMRDSTLARYSSRAINFWDGIANADGTIATVYNWDGTHLNNAGHAVLYDRVRTTVTLSVALTASPADVNFGDQRVGSPSTRAVTINNGSGSAISLTSIYTGSAQFTADRSSGTVNAGGSLTVNITFTPNTLGWYQDTLFIQNNSAISLLRVLVTGNAPAPSLAAAPASLDFGEVVRTTTKQLQISLNNTGINTAQISGITGKTGIFTATPTAGSIVASSSMQITVSFTPGALGAFTDTLRVTGGVAGGLFTIPVRGQSPVPVLTSSATFLDFGDIPITAPKTLQITLGNTSINPLVLDALANTHPQYYVEPSSGTIPPSGTLGVNVVFSPSAYGVVLDTILVISNASVSPSRIALRGNSSNPNTVEDISGETPLRYALLQNYPNPFNPSTTVGFALPEASRVSLMIYDLIGREIAVLADGRLPAGRHRRIWDARESAAGTYFSRLVAVPEGRNGEPFVELRRLILLK